MMVVVLYCDRQLNLLYFELFLITIMIGFDSKTELSEGFLKLFKLKRGGKWEMVMREKGRGPEDYKEVVYSAL